MKLVWRECKTRGDTVWRIELSRFLQERGYRMLSFVDKYEHLGYKKGMCILVKGKNTVLSFKIDRFIKKIESHIFENYG